MSSAARSSAQSSSVSAMAVSAFRVGPSAKDDAYDWPSEAEAIELQDIVRRTHEGPLTLHLLEPPQKELPEAARVLDLSDDRLDDPFARRVDSRAGLRQQLASHSVDDRCGLRQRASRTRPRAF